MLGEIGRNRFKRQLDIGGSRYQAWSLTLLLVVLYIINTSDKLVLGLVAQPLKEEFGLSASQIGLVGSAFFLTFTIGGFFAGLINRWATLKWSLAILALVWASTMVPVMVVAGFAVLLISRLVLGFAEGPSGALIHTAVYSWHPPQKRGLPGAFITSGGSLAKIIVAPVVAIAVAAWGWRAGFGVLAVAGVVWCVVWLSTWKEGPYGGRAARKGDEPAGSVERVPWMRIFLTPTFIGSVVALISMYCLFTAVLTWLPSYFEVGLGYDRLTAGVMFALPSFVAMAALFVTTAITDHLLSRGGSYRLLRGIVPAVALLFGGISLAMLPFIDTPAIAVAVVSVGYGIASINFPILNAGVSHICPPKQLAGTLGLLLALMAIGGLIAPYLTGVVVDAAPTQADGYATAFQIFGVTAVVASIVALFTINPDRDARKVLHSLTTVSVGGDR